MAQVDPAARTLGYDVQAIGADRQSPRRSAATADPRRGEGHLASLIVESPIRSVVIAYGTGFLLGRWLRL
ncbi:hypothetical protein [Chelatococcus reniformis]|uniref:Uncharacterized protein n=1 Tax=Chelatococcus reniformis TaxID=1494448 RepID=A0A916USU9_9HYPH|nr:hypothetical protein [Chelatococcus reniformis]GGC85184.1 hypothetical protein GCM10010994_48830 [Chelatococcus reniformis]